MQKLPLKKTPIALAIGFVMAVVVYLHTLGFAYVSALPAEVVLMNTKYHPPVGKESLLDDASGVKKHVYHNNVGNENEKPKDTLLVVVNIASMTSFGPDRQFSDLMHVIKSLEYNHSAVSLGFFCGTSELFYHVDNYFTNLFEQHTREFPKVTILSADFLKSSFATSEHAAEKQRARRRLIARARNFALLHSLDMEKYTLFIDADVIEIDHPDMVKRFIASGKDIIVPRVTKGNSDDYDKNSWRGDRTKPSDDQLRLMNSNEWDKLNYEPKDINEHMYHMGDFAKADAAAPHKLKGLDTIVELDSVGGAILFAKSIIYKQGVVFPPTYVVGTTWDRVEGYDGIETEGLCYLAKPLGYSCWGMPNLVAKHTQ